MKYNIIYTDKEYMAQGFTREEVPMIRKHDELYNEYTALGRPDDYEHLAEMYELAEKLGL